MVYFHPERENSIHVLYYTIMRCFLWLIFLLQKNGVEKGATNQKQFNKVRNTAPRAYKKGASLCSWIRRPLPQLKVTCMWTVEIYLPIKNFWCLLINNFLIFTYQELFDIYLSRAFDMTYKFYLSGTFCYTLCCNNICCN